MPRLLKVGDIEVNVVFKRIKNIHLRVHPPDGRVTVSAPNRISLKAIHEFVSSKIAWIQHQQARMRQRPQEQPHRYTDGEQQPVWGRLHVLRIIETDGKPSVVRINGEILLKVAPGASKSQRKSMLEEWHILELQSALPALLNKWEAALGVKAARISIRRMKTRWGSCSPVSRHIRFNANLSQKPFECLDYLVLHELAHLIEASHNARFVGLLDRHMPTWREYREMLNQPAVSLEPWDCLMEACRQG